MSTSDGNSTTRPLRRRQSKRFDRSGGSPSMTVSTVLDAGDGDGDFEVDVPESGHEESDGEAVVSTTPIGADRTPSSDPETGSDDDDDGAAADGDGAAVTDADDSADVDDDAGDEARSATTSPSSAGSIAPDEQADDRPSDAVARGRTLDQIAPCGRCGHDVSIVHIEVDGNVLMMESCDNCDTRRWQLAGEPIELQEALDHVGEHTGRRR